MSTRTLIVDDNAAMRLVLCTTAEINGYTVVGEACDGAEAIDAAAELQPDLVVLDIAMPVLDGLDALPRIQEVAPGAEVVLLTGLDTGTLDIPSGIRCESKDADLVFLFDRLSLTLV